MGIWAVYMSVYDKFSILLDHIEVMITMAFGAFIAGSSPEGSAAIAYPVFTLLLDIAPADTRNFAFSIQSIGMTAASLFILSSMIKVDWQYIRYVSTSGAIGLIAGMYFIAPNVDPSTAKLAFVSVWMSFGLIMLFMNRRSQRLAIEHLPLLSGTEILILITGGLLGGILSSIFGTGINMLTFCILVVYFNLNEKVATSSSILIMTFETILGFFWHHFIFEDISEKSYAMWLSAIPIVLIFAPLGTFMMSKTPGKFYSTLLYALFIVQYIAALFVLKPSGTKLWFSIVVIASSLFIFGWLLKIKKRTVHS